MRKILLLVTIGACAADPHQLVACSGYSVNGAPFVGTCERACETPSPDYQGSGAQPSCSAVNESVSPIYRVAQCSSSFEVDGVRGCCQSLSEPAANGATFRFWACQ